MPVYTSLETIRSAGVPVVIFGAGSSGEALYYAAKKSGIVVSGFADTYIPNITRVNGALCGLPAIYSGDLPGKYGPETIFLVSANYISDHVHKLERLGFTRWFPGGELLKGFDLSEVPTFVRDFAHMRHSVEGTIDSHDAFLHPELLHMRSVEFQITERCSMNCDGCSNLMHLYQHPQNFGTAEILTWMDAFCRYIDRVGEARVIGGEPFMNRDCAEIVRRCAEKPQFQRVTIFTNGTIPLKQEQLDLMSHPKVVFLITAYEGFKQRHDEIRAQLKANGIKCVYQEASGWTDCGHILPQQNRGDAELTEFFQTCCGNKLFTISRGNLYRCSWNANAVGLGDVPDYEQDRVNLMQGGDIKEELRRFMNDLPFLKACDFCPGRRLDDPEVTPGIQVPRLRPYAKLTQIG